MRPLHVDGMGESLRLSQLITAATPHSFRENKYMHCATARICVDLTESRSIPRHVRSVPGADARSHREGHSSQG